MNEAFLNYVSKTERDTLSIALTKDSFDEEILDDLDRLVRQVFMQAETHKRKPPEPIKQYCTQRAHPET